MRLLSLILSVALAGCECRSTETAHVESVTQPPPNMDGLLPAPVKSLADGVWMKGDLHVHSRHSDDSTNNPVSKIVVLSEAVGMDYLLISDHDNHVGGDVANHTWIDPEYTSNSLLLLTV